MFTGADSLQSMNYILSNEDFYNKNEAEAARISSNSSSYGAFIGIGIVLIAGLMYDLIGRRLTVCITFAIGAFSTIGIPLVSPSIIGYNIMRVAFTETLVFMVSNPFINDYVKAQSRGKATAW